MAPPPPQPRPDLLAGLHYLPPELAFRLGMEFNSFINRVSTEDRCFTAHVLLDNTERVHDYCKVRGRTCVRSPYTAAQHGLSAAPGKVILNIGPAN